MSTRGPMGDIPRYNGICKGGPIDGRPLVHTMPTKMFGDWVNPPSDHVVAGEPEQPPAKMVINPTGHYSWNYTEKCWDWFGRP